MYRAALELIPHKRFTFAKLWLLYAQFEIRQKQVMTFFLLIFNPLSCFYRFLKFCSYLQVDVARRALGSSLGKCPKAKLFRGYIDLEIQLREFSRCRTLYEKFLEFNPENVQVNLRLPFLLLMLHFPLSSDLDEVRRVGDVAG